MQVWVLGLGSFGFAVVGKKAQGFKALGLPAFGFCLVASLLVGFRVYRSFSARLYSLSLRGWSFLCSM